jgi:hypothetical protein
VSAADQGQVGLATGPDWNSLTKYGSNPVIAKGGGGSWNLNGTFGADYFIDPDDPGQRMHIWAAGAGSANTGIGYWRSDNLGQTCTVGGNNPLVVQGASGSADFSMVGDVITVVPDVDVVCVFHGISNVTNYPTNNPMRGLGVAIVPWKKDAPRKPAKFYYPGGSRPYTSVTTGVLNLTAFTLCARFRAFRTVRTQYRQIFTEAAAFNLQALLGIDGASGANQGKLKGYFRIVGTETFIYSSATVDDGLWHDVAIVRRTSGTLWEMYIDGVSVGTSATANSTTSSASNKAIGNWHASAGEPDEPFRGTISDVVILDAPIAAADVAKVLRDRTIPGGVNIAMDWAGTGGTDNGTVHLVDALPPRGFRRVLGA